MNSLEFFADAIMHFEGWSAGSVSYRNRNPGNLRASRTAISEDQGYAVFASFIDGYTALVTDLAAKFSGRTSTGLGPQSTVLQFFRAYAPAADSNYPDQYAAFVAHWMTVALRRVVTVNTRLEEIWAPRPPEGS